MELKQLAYFKAVADEGTISGAARKLNMSQPPLSSQMHLLEQELGCVLFERGSRKIRLTEAGRMFYDRACAMLDLARFTAQEMEDYQKGKAGALRIGVVSSVGSLFLEKWMVPFHKEFPQIRYEIYEGNTYQMLEQVRSNLVEAALVRTPFEAGELKTIHLAGEPMMAAGLERFFEGIPKPEGKKKGSLTLEQLAGKPLIVYRRWEEVLGRAFAKAGVQPLYLCKNDDARTSLEWAAAGMGIAIFPASAKAMADKRKVRVYQLQEEELVSEICAVYNPHGYISLAAENLLKRMEEGSTAKAKRKRKMENE